MSSRASGQPARDSRIFRAPSALEQIHLNAERDRQRARAGRNAEDLRPAGYADQPPELFVRRANELTPPIRRIPGFTYPTTEYELTAAAAEVWANGARKVQFIADGRVIVRCGLDLLGEVPANTLVEVNLGEVGMPVHLLALPGDGTIPYAQQRTALVAPGTTYGPAPAAPTTYTGADVTLSCAEAFLYGETIYHMTLIGGAGTFQLEKNAATVVADYLVVTNAIALATTPANTNIRVPYLNDYVQRLVSTMRLSVTLNNIGDSVTFDYIEHIYSPLSGDRSMALVDPATIRMFVGTDGLLV